MYQPLFRIKIKHATKWYKKGEEYLVKDPQTEDNDYFTVCDLSHLHGASILIKDCDIINKY